eukprot:101760-Pelagomonas_calceolata.AAC.1
MKAQFLPSDEPFLYLGVQFTMDLNWKYQHMTCNLRENLNFSLTQVGSPRQAKDMTCIAISPNLAYAFAVTPCTPADLIIWDKTIDRIIEHKYNLCGEPDSALHILPGCKHSTMSNMATERHNIASRILL